MSDHYTEAMYRIKGREVGLEYMGPLPARVTDKTNWRCLNKNCNKHHFKTYRALCLRPNGCRCQSPTTLDRSKYIEAAEKNGIRWTPADDTMPPPNSKTPTGWTGPNGELVLASYHEVAYKMPIRLQKALGITVDEERQPRKRRGRKPSELRGLPPQRKGRRSLTADNHLDPNWTLPPPKEKKRRGRPRKEKVQ